MRRIPPSRLCNSSLLVKHTRQQMRAQGAINANYPRGPGRTESAGGCCGGGGGSRVKCAQGSNSAAVLAATKQLQQREQGSISWAVRRELGLFLWIGLQVLFQSRNTSELHCVGLDKALVQTQGVLEGVSHTCIYLKITGNVYSI